MTFRGPRGVLLLAVACILAACGAAEEPAGERGDGPLVVYTREGGIVGYTDRLVIAADGSALLDDGNGRTRVSLPGARLTRLESALDGVDWQRLEDDRPPPDGAADLITLSIAFEGHRVSWTDLGQREPELDAVAAELARIMSEFPNDLSCPQGTRGEGCSRGRTNDR